MKNILLLILSFSLFFTNLTQAAESNSNPRDYIVKIADQIFKVILNKNTTVEEQREILEQRFIDEIDFNWNARAVSGQYWREMTNIQRSDFVSGYKSYLIRYWLPKFNGYRNEKYEILQKYETTENGDFMIKIILTLNNNANISLVLRVRKVDDSFKILNIIAEGVDMARVYNIQFTEYIEKFGIDELIKYLKTGKSKNIDVKK